MCFVHFVCFVVWFRMRRRGSGVQLSTAPVPDLGPHCDDMFDWLKKPGPARGLSPDVRREPTRAVRPPGGRYEPVCRYVENRYADTVVLTFAEVEDLLGFSLPELARVELEWWANALTVTSRTVTPNLAAEIVSFERTS